MYQKSPCTHWVLHVFKIFRIFVCLKSPIYPLLRLYEWKAVLLFLVYSPISYIFFILSTHILAPIQISSVSQKSYLNQPAYKVLYALEYLQSKLRTAYLPRYSPLPLLLSECSSSWVLPTNWRQWHFFGVHTWLIKPFYFIRDYCANTRTTSLAFLCICSNFLEYLWYLFTPMVKTSIHTIHTLSPRIHDASSSRIHHCLFLL